MGQGVNFGVGLVLGLGVVVGCAREATEDRPPTDSVTTSPVAVPATAPTAAPISAPRRVRFGSSGSLVWPV